MIAVHINGHPAEMESLVALKVPIIEDAAEAHGAECRVKGKWRKVGGIGTMGCFSFYANKVITTGEGGVVTTNDRNLAERVREMRNLSRSKERHFYHREVAFAYRMSNLEAALGLAQMEEVEKFMERKRNISQLYGELLCEVKGLELPVEKKYARRLHWYYEIKLDR